MSSFITALPFGSASLEQRGVSWMHRDDPGWRQLCVYDDFSGYSRLRVWCHKRSKTSKTCKPREVKMASKKDNSNSSMGTVTSPPWMKAALWLLSYDDDGSQQQHYPVLEGRTYGEEVIHSSDARCQTHCLPDYDGYGYGYPNREIVSRRAMELKLT